MRAPGGRPERLMADGPSDLDLSGAQLRADSRDLPAFIAALAARLEDAVGDGVEVDRRRAGLFRGDRVVRAIRCPVGEEVYALELDGARATATRAKAVRGITIRTEELPVDAWTAALVAAIGEQADRSSQAWSALHDLVAR